MKNSYSTKIIASVSVGACIMMVADAAKAQSINYSTRGAVGFPAYVGTGAAPDAGTVWNTAVRNGTTGSGFGDSDSMGNLVGVTFMDHSGGQYGGGQPAQVNGTPGALFEGFFLQGGSGVVNETLNNVSAGTYDLFLYGSNTGQDRGVTFSVAGYGSLSTVNANVIGSEAPPTAFVNGINYVEFAGITLASPGSINFSYTANPAITRNGQPGDNYGVNAEGDFNGLQLVAVVPEPSTYVLTGLGLVSLLGFRRWKRGQATT